MALNIQNVISVPTLADLKTMRANSNDAIILLGKTTTGDGSGLLYFWKVDSTANVTEDLINMTIVFVTNVTDGYWQRLFLSNIVLPHGLLVTTGGVKRFFSTYNYVTDANGQCTINLTRDNTPTGPAIFNTILWNRSAPKGTPGSQIFTNANDMITGTEQLTTSNLKQTTHLFTRGNNQAISLLGITVLGYRVVPTGTPVQFLIEGI